MLSLKAAIDQHDFQQKQNNKKGKAAKDSMALFENPTLIGSGKMLKSASRIASGMDST